MDINYNPFTLQGKTILITGASSGIGQTTAIECSKLGAKCIITGRNAERLQQTYNQLEGIDHQQVLADLTQSSDMELLISSIDKLNGMVLCAGRAGGNVPVIYSTREKFDEVYNTNLFSPIEILRLLCKNKKIEKNASAVIIVSIGGISKFAPGGAIYGSAKAALKAMVNFYAVELAPKKIRVNGVCPGMVETPLIHADVISQDQLDADKAKYPLKRYGLPIDIAHGAIYLLSDASSWLTGQSIIIDGGLSARG